jgi:hypothetical protein
MAEATEMSQVDSPTSKTRTVSPVKPSFSEGDIQKILKRAEKGDQDCLPDVRALLADPDNGPNYRECFGSSVGWLRQTLIQKAMGKNVLGQEAVEQELDRIRAELEGPNPTPIERLLAERASLCWFILNRYENAYANANGWNISQADLQHRKIDKAHARFLSAVRTLAQVRKLALPTLQVNIGQNQVNMAESRS